MNSEKQSTNLQMTLREVNRVGEGKKNIPKLRFKGYEDAWEQRKLGDIAESTYGGGTPKTTVEEFWNGEIPWIQSSDIQEDQVFNVQVRKTITEKGLANSAAKLIPKNSIAIVTRVGVGKLGLIPFDFTTSQDFLSLSSLNIDSNFALYLLFKRLQFESKMAQGTSIKGITKEELLSKEVKIAHIDMEQKSIGYFFQNLDDIITLHQRKYDALKTMKKTLLSKMFPKDGEDVPEIRFKGFTDAWEQRKLGEEVQIVMGQSPKGENYTDNPKDYILVQGNADMKDGKVFPRVWTTQVTKQAYKGDIILSVRAPVGDIGKTDYDVVIGRGVAAVKGNEFFYQLLGKLKQDGYWTKSSTGSTFDSINSNEIKNAKVTIPDIKEQLLIGDYFQGIDNLITLHQRKLDELKNMKKTLLQQMFV